MWNLNFFFCLSITGWISVSIEPVWNLNKVDISKMYFLVAVSIEPVWNLNTYQINNNSHHQNSEHRTSVEFKLIK